MVLDSERLAVHEALNHYETLDGRQVTVRAVAILERDAQGRIEAMRVYNDQSPVWAAGVMAKEVSKDVRPVETAFSA